MIHATYIGPPCGWNVSEGMCALIRQSSKPNTVLAQFDDFWARRDKDLASGWHEFPADHFRPNTMNTLCDYCKQPAKLITGLELYPHRDDLAELSFWKCEPCGAWVGCHKAGSRIHLGHASVTSDGTLPLGRLANAELRAAKTRAHAAFDPCWRTYTVWRQHPAYTPDAKYPAARRRLLYGWLAKAMRLQPHECHIGMFTETQCDQVVTVVNEALVSAEA